MDDYIQNIEIKVESQMIRISFNPYVISKNEIIDEIKEAGIQVSSSEKKEKGFKNWLSNLARQNNKNLGSQRLDCCGFNH